MAIIKYSTGKIKEVLPEDGKRMPNENIKKVLEEAEKEKPKDKKIKKGK